MSACEECRIGWEKMLSDAELECTEYKARINELEVKQRKLLYCVECKKDEPGFYTTVCTDCYNALQAENAKLREALEVHCAECKNRAKLLIAFGTPCETCKTYEALNNPPIDSEEQ